MLTFVKSSPNLVHSRSGTLSVSSQIIISGVLGTVSGMPSSENVYAGAEGLYDIALLLRTITL